MSKRVTAVNIDASVCLRGAEADWFNAFHRSFVKINGSKWTKRDTLIRMFEMGMAGLAAYVTEAKMVCPACGAEPSEKRGHTEMHVELRASMLKGWDTECQPAHAGSCASWRRERRAVGKSNLP